MAARRWRWWCVARRRDAPPRSGARPSRRACRPGSCPTHGPSWLLGRLPGARRAPAPRATASGSSWPARGRSCHARWRHRRHCTPQPVHLHALSTATRSTVAGRRGRRCAAAGSRVRIVRRRTEGRVGYSPMRFEARLQAALPAGWFVKESITLLAPDGAGNVIVSTEPLDPSIDTARYAEVQGELLRNEFPGFTEL